LGVVIVAYVPDLMDRSKVAAAGDVTFVTRPEDLVASGADTVLVDLARPGVLDVLGSLGSARIVGFASHVDRPLLDAARAAGCTEVLARSAFFSRLAELLS
jgi:hypothetical protein